MASVQTPDPWWAALVRAIDVKDTDGFVGFLTADAEFRFGSAPPVEGTAAIRQAVDGFFATIERSEHELLRSWSDEATRVCEGRVTYTRHDGSRLCLPFANVFEMRAGKISRYSIYIDIAPLHDRGDAAA